MRITFSRFLVGAAIVVLAGCASTPRQDNLTGEYLSGRFASRVNAFEDAAEAYADAAAAAPDVDVIAGRAFSYYLASGDIEMAAVYASRLASADNQPEGGAELARLTIAAQAIKAGSYARAKAVLAESGNVPFLEPAAFLMGVWTEVGMKGPEAGLRILNNPHSEFIRAFTLVHRGLLSEQVGHDDEARASYQAALLGAYGGLEASLAYGSLLERTGNVGGAREFYALIGREAGPVQRAAKANIARIDAGKKNTANAIKTPAKASALGFYVLGEALLQQMVIQREAVQNAGFSSGDPSFVLPLSLAQLALYLDPELDSARRRVASMFMLYGDYERAIEEFEHIPPESPYFEQSRIEQAGALTILERQKEAIALLEIAARDDESAVNVRLSLATLLAIENRHADAVDLLNKVIGTLGEDPEPDAWRFFIARGASLLELDCWPEAEADLKRAVAIAPEEPTALNYLGYSWAERGLNLEEAFELIEKAVSLQPGSGAIIDSLGWAYYQLGNYEEALVHLENAASLEPADPTITDHLGDVYWRLSRKIEARYQWLRALELEPSEKLRFAVEAKINQGLPGDNQ